MLTNIVKFAAKNSVTIMKVVGTGLSIGGMVLTSIAGDKQQKIDIANAIEKAKNTTN